MANLKSRIEQLEEEQWQEACEWLCRALDGRSEEDREFFCVHGYLPEVPIPGRPVDTSTLRRMTWEEFKRFTAGRSVKDKEFFAVHGRWPDQAHQGLQGLADDLIDRPPPANH
jgi:hypothetical protein